jgi:hypothetical protein
MAMHGQTTTGWADGMHEMRRPDDDEVGYATGWTISGLATLGTIIAVWLLGI